MAAATKAAEQTRSAAPKPCVSASVPTRYGAAAPYLVGTLADTHGFGAALLVCSAAFVAAAMFWIWIPETKGRALA